MRNPTASALAVSAFGQIIEHTHPSKVLFVTNNPLSSIQLSNALNLHYPQGYAHEARVVSQDGILRAFYEDGKDLAAGERFFGTRGRMENRALLHAQWLELPLVKLRPGNSPFKFIDQVHMYFDELSRALVNPDEFIDYVSRLPQSLPEYEYLYELSHSYKTFREIKRDMGFLTIGDKGLDVLEMLKSPQVSPEFVKILQKKYKRIILVDGDEMHLGPLTLLHHAFGSGIHPNAFQVLLEDLYSAPVHPEQLKLDPFAELNDPKFSQGDSTLTALVDNSHPLPGTWAFQQRRLLSAMALRSNVLNSAFSEFDRACMRLPAANTRRLLLLRGIPQMEADPDAARGFRSPDMGPGYAAAAFNRVAGLPELHSVGALLADFLNCRNGEFDPKRGFFGLRDPRFPGQVFQTPVERELERLSNKLNSHLLHESGDGNNLSNGEFLDEEERRLLEIRLSGLEKDPARLMENEDLQDEQNIVRRLIRPYKWSTIPIQNEAARCSAPVQALASRIRTVSPDTLQRHLQDSGVIGARKNVDPIPYSTSDLSEAARNFHASISGTDSSPNVAQQGEEVISKKTIDLLEDLNPVPVASSVIPPSLLRNVSAQYTQTLPLSVLHPFEARAPPSLRSSSDSLSTGPESENFTPAKENSSKNFAELVALNPGASQRYAVARLIVGLLTGELAGAADGSSAISVGVLLKSNAESLQFAAHIERTLRDLVDVQTALTAARRRRNLDGLERISSAKEEQELLDEVLEDLETEPLLLGDLGAPLLSSREILRILLNASKSNTSVDDVRRNDSVKEVSEDRSSVDRSSQLDNLKVALFADTSQETKQEPVVQTLLAFLGILAKPHNPENWHIVLSSPFYGIPASVVGRWTDRLLGGPGAFGSVNSEAANSASSSDTSNTAGGVDRLWYALYLMSLNIRVAESSSDVLVKNKAEECDPAASREDMRRALGRAPRTAEDLKEYDVKSTRAADPRLASSDYLESDPAYFVDAAQAERELPPAVELPNGGLSYEDWKKEEALKKRRRTYAAKKGLPADPKNDPSEWVDPSVFYSRAERGAEAASSSNASESVAAEVESGEFDIDLDALATDRYVRAHRFPRQRLLPASLTPLGTSLNDDAERYAPNVKRFLEDVELFLENFRSHSVERALAFLVASQPCLSMDDAPSDSEAAEDAPAAPSHGDGATHIDKVARAMDLKMSSDRLAARVLRGETAAAVASLLGLVRNLEMGSSTARVAVGAGDDAKAAAMRASARQLAHAILRASRGLPSALFASPSGLAHQAQNGSNTEPIHDFITLFEALSTTVNYGNLRFRGSANLVLSVFGEDGTTSDVEGGSAPGDVPGFSQLLDMALRQQASANSQGSGSLGSEEESAYSPVLADAATHTAFELVTRPLNDPKSREILDSAARLFSGPRPPTIVTKLKDVTLPTATEPQQEWANYADHDLMMGPHEQGLVVPGSKGTVVVSTRPFSGDGMLHDVINDGLNPRAVGEEGAKLSTASLIQSDLERARAQARDSDRHRRFIRKQQFADIVELAAAASLGRKDDESSPLDLTASGSTLPHPLVFVTTMARASDYSFDYVIIPDLTRSSFPGNFRKGSFPPPTPVCSVEGLVSASGPDDPSLRLDPLARAIRSDTRAVYTFLQKWVSPELVHLTPNIEPETDAADCALDNAFKTKDFSNQTRTNRCEGGDSILGNVSSNPLTLPPRASLKALFEEDLRASLRQAITRASRGVLLLAPGLPTVDTAGSRAAVRAAVLDEIFGPPPPLRCMFAVRDRRRQEVLRLLRHAGPGIPGVRLLDENKLLMDLVNNSDESEVAPKHQQDIFKKLLLLVRNPLSAALILPGVVRADSDRLVDRKRQEEALWTRLAEKSEVYIDSPSNPVPTRVSTPVSNPVPNIVTTSESTPSTLVPTKPSKKSSVSEREGIRSFAVHPWSLFTLSYSTASEFQSCPRRVLYRKLSNYPDVGGVPLVYGSALHNAMELLSALIGRAVHGVLEASGVYRLYGLQQQFGMDTYALQALSMRRAALALSLFQPLESPLTVPPALFNTKPMEEVLRTLEMPDSEVKPLQDPVFIESDENVRISQDNTNSSAFSPFFSYDANASNRLERLRLLELVRDRGNEMVIASKSSRSKSSSSRSTNKRKREASVESQGESVESGGFAKLSSLAIVPQLPPTFDPASGLPEAFLLELRRAALDALPSVGELITIMRNAYCQEWSSVSRRRTAASSAAPSTLGDVLLVDPPHPTRFPSLLPLILSAPCTIRSSSSSGTDDQSVSKSKEGEYVEIRALSNTEVQNQLGRAMDAVSASYGDQSWMAAFPERLGNFPAHLMDLGSNVTENYLARALAAHPNFSAYDVTAKEADALEAIQYRAFSELQHVVDLLSGKKPTKQYWGIPHADTSKFSDRVPTQPSRSLVASVELRFQMSLEPLDNARQAAQDPLHHQLVSRSIAMSSKRAQRTLFNGAIDRIDVQELLSGLDTHSRDGLPSYVPVIREYKSGIQWKADVEKNMSLRLKTAQPGIYGAAIRRSMGIVDPVDVSSDPDAASLRARMRQHRVALLDALGEELERLTSSAPVEIVEEREGVKCVKVPDERLASLEAACARTADAVYRAQFSSSLHSELGEDVGLLAEVDPELVHEARKSPRKAKFALAKEIEEVSLTRMMRMRFPLFQPALLIENAAERRRALRLSSASSFAASKPSDLLVRQPFSNANDLTPVRELAAGNPHRAQTLIAAGPSPSASSNPSSPYQQFSMEDGKSRLSNINAVPGLGEISPPSASAVIAAGTGNSPTSALPSLPSLPMIGTPSRSLPTIGSSSSSPSSSLVAPPLEPVLQVGIESVEIGAFVAKSVGPDDVGATLLEMVDDAACIRDETEVLHREVLESGRSSSELDPAKIKAFPIKPSVLCDYCSFAKFCNGYKIAKAKGLVK